MSAIAIFGATSAIAEQMARLYAAEGARLCLIARDPVRLKAVADDLRARGAAATEEIAFDFSAIADLPALLENIKTRFGMPDRALIAYGTLPNAAATKTWLRPRSISISLAPLCSCKRWRG
jgi:NADP-dependent 3-hydroxy acid dehydrogenase YdfG